LPAGGQFLPGPAGGYRLRQLRGKLQVMCWQYLRRFKENIEGGTPLATFQSATSSNSHFECIGWSKKEAGIP
jgi:hypothetical protein